MKTRLHLPDGIEDLLQPAAWQFEQLRRSVLDLFASWGFQYVEPPVVEYLDTLLVLNMFRTKDLHNMFYFIRITKRICINIKYEFSIY